MTRKEHVIQLLTAGKTYNQICEETGLAKSTVSYYASKTGFTRKNKKASESDLANIQKLINEGKKYADISSVTKIAESTIYALAKKGLLKLRPYKTQMDIDSLLDHFKGKRLHSYDHSIIKGIFFKEGRTACEMCFNELWLGKRITLELDHIDGNPRNNILENLRLLCPNCHSTTPTWMGRNKNK